MAYLPIFIPDLRAFSLNLSCESEFFCSASVRLLFGSKSGRRIGRDAALGEGYVEMSDQSFIVRRSSSLLDVRSMRSLMNSIDSIELRSARNRLRPYR